MDSFLKWLEKRKLRSWLGACDPEISILCILIAQAVLRKRENALYYGGLLSKTYASDPDALLDEADIPEEWRKIWKARDWSSFEKYLSLGKGDGKQEHPDLLPTTRGFP